MEHKKIICLPPEISQRIAAGEVIERPFSVVKELVENSLDAGALEIKIELRTGGKKLIRVTDNGEGMGREDALACFERHSTSKIAGVEDLLRIATLGFRGEALPSISSVSRVVLKTSDSQEGRGTLIERRGEELVRTGDTAFPRGTSVEVQDLFFNLPARKKFLRSERSEMSLIVKYLTWVSLAYPEVRFSLVHGKRQVFDFVQAKNLKERIFQVYGKSYLDRLMEVDYEEEAWKLQGYASRPPSGRRDRTRQVFFVNRRPVRNRTLLAALNQSYRGFLEKDQHAEAFLFLSCPLAEVDVNVHPAKAEVRFRNSHLAFRLTARGIEKARLKEAGIKEIYSPREEKRGDVREEEESRTPGFKISEERELGWRGLFPSGTKEEKKGPRVLGQYLGTYIVALIEEDIVIIDQHNAHERVLFEQYQEIDRRKKWPRKLALFPILLELAPSQVLGFKAHQTLLEEIGFRVEAMGGNSYALREFPDIFMEREGGDIFLSLLEEMEEEKIENKKNRMVAALACKTAMKAGKPLSFEKMSYLVEELLNTSNPSLCPHGRPTMVKIERREIERSLRRR